MAGRPNILKLATKISLEGMTYTGLTYKDPEYRILEPIVTDDMCEIMMHMRLEANRTAEDIARRAKKSVEFTQKQCDLLREAGLIRTRMVDGERCYYYPIWVPGIMEGVLSNREQCEKYPVLGECFEEYTRRKVSMLAPFMAPGMNMMRVIPVQSAIESDSRRASYDEVNSLVENAWAISVGPCSCRRARRLMGEGCGHLEEDMCMYLNDNAVNYAEIGAHRLIDKEEAYEILRRAERNGLVHELNVSAGFDDTTAICNCCGCSCFALRIASYFKAPDAIRTNYLAKVDKDKCAACGRCVENCQVNAVRLGKKLCNDPVAIDRPAETTENTIWTGKRYEPDHRKIRVNTTERGTAPCKAACPAGVPVQAYIKLASEGRYDEALELIKGDLPFPAVCGRICNKPCEAACTRGELDLPVAIDEIKKFIAERDLSAGTRYIPDMLNTIGRPYTEKIAVIGGGPSGLSCAYYLAMKGYPVTVFEKENVLGGMLTLGIPSFRLDKKVINSEIDVLRDMGVEFRTGIDVGRDITIDDLRADGYKAFYLAMGAAAGSELRCPGGDKDGLISGIDFLRSVNKDEKPEIGSRVAVIGGGNVALDVARSAVRLGADVTVYYRRSRDEMPADAEEVAEAEAESVKFEFLMSPAEVTGDGKVTGLRMDIMKLGDPDASGRRRPEPTGETREVPADTVITATGQKVDMCGMDISEGLKVRADGTLVADAVTGQTAAGDIFAGGDLVTGPKFAIDAIAAGRAAAVSIHRYVKPGQTLDLGRDSREYKAFRHDDSTLVPIDFDKAPRHSAGRADSAFAVRTFDDLRDPFTEEEARAECARCLSCGTAVVDEYMCVGCGVCTTHCRFDAIHLVKVHDAGNSEYFHTLGKIVAHVPEKGVKIAKKNISRYAAAISERRSR